MIKWRGNILLYKITLTSSDLSVILPTLPLQACKNPSIQTIWERKIPLWLNLTCSEGVTGRYSFILKAHEPKRLETTDLPAEPEVTSAGVKVATTWHKLAKISSVSWGMNRLISTHLRLRLRYLSAVKKDGDGGGEALSSGVCALHDLKVSCRDFLFLANMTAPLQAETRMTGILLGFTKTHKLKPGNLCANGDLPALCVCVLKRVCVPEVLTCKRVLVEEEEDVIFQGTGVKKACVFVYLCVCVLNVHWGICEIEVKMLSHYSHSNRPNTNNWI